MPTLHIEHPIHDFDLWAKAFGEFAEARARGGVTDQRVLRPIDDDHYIVVELDFATTQAAESFLTFLRTQVWSSPQASPALAGTPRARILQPAWSAPDSRQSLSGTL